MASSHAEASSFFWRRERISQEETSGLPRRPTFESATYDASQTIQVLNVLRGGCFTHGGDCAENVWTLWGARKTSGHLRMLAFSLGCGAAGRSASGGAGGGTGRRFFVRTSRGDFDGQALVALTPLTRAGPILPSMVLDEMRLKAHGAPPPQQQLTHGDGAMPAMVAPQADGEVMSGRPAGLHRPLHSCPQVPPMTFRPQRARQDDGVAARVAPCSLGNAVGEAPAIVDEPSRPRVICDSKRFFEIVPQARMQLCMVGQGLEVDVQTS